MRGAQLADQFHILKHRRDGKLVLQLFPGRRAIQLVRARLFGPGNANARAITLLIVEAGDTGCAGRSFKSILSRFKENSEKMIDGDLLNVAQVLKGLLMLQHEKPLSFREKKMLDRARHMLVTELTIARRLHEEEAVAILQKALAMAHLSLPPVL